VAFLPMVELCDDFGGELNTDWLDSCIALENRRFVRSGAELAKDWKLELAPFLLETRRLWGLRGRRCESEERKENGVRCG